MYRFSGPIVERIHAVLVARTVEAQTLLRDFQAELQGQVDAQAPPTAGHTDIPNKAQE